MNELYVVIDGDDGDLLGAYFNEKKADDEAENLLQSYPLMRVEITTIEDMPITYTEAEHKADLQREKLALLDEFKELLIFSGIDVRLANNLTNSLKQSIQGECQRDDKQSEDK